MHFCHPEVNDIILLRNDHVDKNCIVIEKGEFIYTVSFNTIMQILILVGSLLSQIIVPTVIYSNLPTNLLGQYRTVRGERKRAMPCTLNCYVAKVLPVKYQSTVRRPCMA